MPVTEHMKQTVKQKSTKEGSPAALRNPSPKATGTRVGTLQDWREGSATGKALRHRGHTLRDGRQSR